MAALKPAAITEARERLQKAATAQGNTLPPNHRLVLNLLEHAAFVAALPPDSITEAKKELRAAAAVATVNGVALPPERAQMLYMLEHAVVETSGHE